MLQSFFILHRIFVSWFKVFDILLEVNSQPKYYFFIFIETLQIVLNMFSLQMSM